MQKEIWKDIPNYEGLYQVSNIGNARSLDRVVEDSRYGQRSIKGVIKSKRISPNGYYRTTLSKWNIKEHKQIHQLVAEAFLNHIPNGYELVINHKDFNKLNNHVNNLEIVTSRENSNKKHIPSTSQYVGVYWSKYHNKFIAEIEIKGNGVHLGVFKNERYAHIAYQLSLAKIKNNE